MNFIDRFNLVKAAFSKQPDQLTTQMAKRFMPTLGEPPKRSTQDWIKLYNKSPRMNPIHQIASDVATSEYGIYHDLDGRKIKHKDNPIALLLKNPCSDKTITEYVLFYIIQVYLLLPAGEAFLIKERSGMGKVTELWPVPPNWVSEIPSSARPYFTVQPLGNMQGQPIHVMPNDMIYFKKPDVSNPYLRGIGRAEGIGDEIETDEYMAKHSKRYFFNNAVPPMVGMMPGADEPSINRAEEKWQQKYGGYNNAHKTAWLNWDAKFQILKETYKEMDFIESRKYLRDVSNQHFNIPPELFGILENSNRSTIDAAYYLYTKNVLRKELKFIDDTLNAQLVPEFADKIYVEHDNVVPEDEEFELKKASEGLKNGGLTVDEWRLANGWEELPNRKGQILYTPLNMIPTALNGNTLETNLQSQQREFPNEEIKKKINVEQKEKIWYIFDKAAIKNERSFINVLKKYFQEQQDKINNKLTKSIKQATDNPDELLDWDEEDTLLLIALTPLWLNSLKEGYEIANSTYGLGISFDLLNSKFLNWIDEFGAEQVTNINNTTKEKLRKTLSEGITEGESIPKLRDRVSNVMTEAKTTRTTLIARTETHNTVGYGTFETYKTVNIQQTEWLTTIDGRERSSHNAINGEIVGMDQDFSNGLAFPGDASGPASELVNCFIGSTKITADSKIINSYKHHYEGELITIKTTTGIELSGTPNHPILTNKGWIALGFINKSHKVICKSLDIKNRSSRINPNIVAINTSIAKIHDSIARIGHSNRITGALVNFHGYVPDSDVEIVFVKSKLLNSFIFSRNKKIKDFFFKFSNFMQKFLSSYSMINKFTIRSFKFSSSLIGFLSKRFSIIIRKLIHSDMHSLRSSSSSDIVFPKNTIDNISIDIIELSKLIDGNTSDIFFDDISIVERDNFSGHVYNLHTDNHIYIANSSISNKNESRNSNGIIVHNCRCVLLPIIPE